MEQMDNMQLVSQIEIAFHKLIKTLVTMSKHDSYMTDREILNHLLNVVLKWKQKFQVQCNLSFISREELLDVYHKFEDLKEKYLYDSSLGNEAELSDKAVIWMWDIMLLRKKQIEKNEI